MTTNVRVRSHSLATQPAWTDSIHAIDSTETSPMPAAKKMKRQSSGTGAKQQNLR